MDTFGATSVPNVEYYPTVNTTQSYVHEKNEMFPIESGTELPKTLK
mgnify:CR=1 FL=1